MTSQEQPAPAGECTDPRHDENVAARRAELLTTLDVLRAAQYQALHSKELVAPVQYEALCIAIAVIEEEDIELFSIQQDRLNFLAAAGGNH